MNHVGKDIQVNEAKRSTFYPRFYGQGSDYAKIWIVNTLLTVLTLGIYSAWAKVRTLKYMYGSTELDGSRFDFTGSPIAILIGRIIAVLLLVLYTYGPSLHPAVGILGLVLFFGSFPWIFIKGLKFKLKNTRFRNIAFSFRGNIKQGCKIWYKYAAIPFVVSLASTIFLLLKETDTENPSMSLILTLFAPILINFIYVSVIASSAITEILNFIYNHIYYGKHKTSIKVILDDVKSKIVYKYMLVAVMGFLALITVSALTVFIKVLAPLMAIAGYLYFVLMGLYLQFLIIDFVWSRITATEAKSITKIEFNTLASISIKNLIIMGFTFGFYYPWATVKLKKYKIENRGIKAINFDAFQAEQYNDESSAIGEELDTAFEFDIDIGL